MTDLIKLCSIGDMADNSAQRFDAGGQRIALIRIDGDFYAIGDRCSHADFSLAEGEVDATEMTIECWKHGSQFSVVDGCPQSLPATRPVPVFTVVVDDGDVYVSVEPR